MADIRATIGLPPTDAVEFFRSKGVYPVSRQWSDVWQEEHARAFTVAKIMDRALLEQVRASLDAVIADGGTFEQWKAQIEPQLRTAGWWDRVENSDLTGVDYPVFIGPARLRTIYDTNLRMARAAGKWKRIQALKAVAPYLRYSAIIDTRTRPEHLAWHGTILPVDHPWWDTHFPPCGWRCRCTTVQLSQRDLRAKGWTVSSVPAENRPQRFRRGNGEIVDVPAGIDPGFAYNVGKHHLRGLVPPPDVGPIETPAIRTLDPPPFPRVMHRLRDDELLDVDTPDATAIQAFLDAFEGQRTPDGTVLANDVQGEPLVIDESFFIHSRQSAVAGASKLLGRKRAQRVPFMIALARALQDPDEIWWGWQDEGKLRRLTRRYIARFQAEGETREAIVLVIVHPNGWQGLTAFVGEDDYSKAESVRGGWLAYRRS